MKYYWCLLLWMLVSKGGTTTPPTTTITSCPPGTFYDSSLVSCTACAVGTYKAVSSNAPQCLACEAGKYDTDVGATTCILCPPGKTSLVKPLADAQAGQTTCSFCPSGSYLSLAELSCLSCPSNHFCDQAGLHPCSQIVHEGEQYMSQACTSTQDAVILACSDCASKGAYTSMPCQNTSDAQCNPCSVCTPMLQYQLSSCSQYQDTLCAACNKEAGDMSIGGRCNPCPAGALWNNKSSTCVLCPAQTYSARPNSLQCSPCGPGSTSGVGSSQCVAACAYAPDGITCLPPASAQSILSAWDPSFSQIQAAAPTLIPGQFLIARSVGSSGINSILYLMGAGASWLAAGSLGLPIGQDGQGEQASFRQVTCMAWDTNTGYLVAEYDGQSAYLRWVESSTMTVTTLQLEGMLLVQQEGKQQPWVSMAYTSGQQFFLASSTGIVLWGGGSSLNAVVSSIMPISLSYNSMSQVLYVLDQGGLIKSISSLYGASGPTLLCGAEGGLSLSEQSVTVGQTWSCSQVDLMASGAIDIVSGSVIYVLFYNNAWSGVGTITLADTSLLLTLIWLQDNNDEVPLSFLKLIDGSLFVVYRSGTLQAQILQLGEGCLCDVGLYCSSTGSCLEAPIGSQSLRPWTLYPTPCPIGYFRQTTSATCQACPQGYTTPTSSGNWFCVPVCDIGLFYDTSSQRCMPGCNQSLGLYHDPVAGACLSCWLGSESSGGIGLDSCSPCQPGQYGVLPGVCAPCPNGYTTEMQATTQCMPSSSSSASSLCNDGGYTSCPSSVLTMSPILPLQTGKSLLVMPDGTYWLKDTPNLLMQYCLSCDILFQATLGSSCVTQESDESVWVGQCGHPGLPAQGLLPSIYGLSLMEVAQNVPVLYISSMIAYEEGTQPCAEVYAVSTYDRSITYFISQDVLKSPLIQVIILIILLERRYML